MTEDNRFLRVYSEYKQQEKQERQERQEQQIRSSNDNRFACLKEGYQPSSIPDNRFACLKNDSQTTADISQSNKFACLLDENYMNRSSSRQEPYSPRQEPYSPRSVPYSPGPYSPRESVNTITRRLSEERRTNQKPKLSFDSDYHFPELGKSPESTKSRTLSIDDFKLDSKKEIITNTYVTPVIQETVTRYFMEKGKVTKKDVAVDGSEIANKIVVTKHTYNSWASVIKSEADNVIKYEKEISN
jgi:hypothetical protein